MSASRFILLLACLPGLLKAQVNPLVGSIPEKRAELYSVRSDTARIRVLVGLSFLQVQTWPDSAIFFAQRSLVESNRINYDWGKEFSLVTMGLGERYLANYPKAIECQQKAMQIAEKLNDTRGLAYSYSLLGAIYRDQGYYEQGLAYMKKGLTYCYKCGEPFITAGTLGGLAECFLGMRDLDSAERFARMGEEISERDHFYFPHIAFVNAGIYERRNEFADAIAMYRKSGEYGRRNHFLRDILKSYSAIGRVYLETRRLDSAIYYGNAVLKDSVNVSVPLMLDAAKLLDESYERKNNKDSIVKYLKLTSALKDSLFGQEQARQVQNLTYNEVLRQQYLADEQARILALQRKNRLTVWYSVILVVLIIVALYIFYRYRIAELVKVQNVRNAISRDLHDDIGSTLSSITLLSGVAEKEIAEGQPGQAIMALKKINAYSYDMVKRMSDIVWAINPRNDNIDSLVLRIKDALAETCAHQQVELAIDADESVRGRGLSMKERKDIYLFCIEAITNAVRHSTCNRIAVRFSGQKHALKISITDDGKGFDVNNNGHGNGLKNMRSRAEELRGSFAIESSPGNTRISCMLP